MPFLTYPSKVDVEALLKSSSYWPTDSTKQDFARLQAEIGATAAADEWERLTGWEPFLASREATERTFTEVDSRGFLDFHGGAVKIESVSVGSQILTPAVGLSYGWRAEPENAVSRHQPITGIHIGGRYGFYNFAASPVVVKAQWGRSDSIPGDAWQAIQQKAALIALTQIENLQNVASISEDGFSKAYDVVGVVTQKDLVTVVWGKSFNQIAQRYLRVVS